MKKRQVTTVNVLPVWLIALRNVIAHELPESKAARFLKAFSKLFPQSLPESKVTEFMELMSLMRFQLLHWLLTNYIRFDLNSSGAREATDMKFIIESFEKKIRGDDVSLVNWSNEAKVALRHAADTDATDCSLALMAAAAAARAARGAGEIATSVWLITSIYLIYPWIGKNSRPYEILAKKLLELLRQTRRGGHPNLRQMIPPHSTPASINP